jgi:hypothetical protein
MKSLCLPWKRLATVQAVFDLIHSIFPCVILFCSPAVARQDADARRGSDFKLNDFANVSRRKGT